MVDNLARGMAKKSIDNTQRVYVERNSSIRFSVWQKPPNGKWIRYEFIRIQTSTTSTLNQDVWHINKVEIGDIPAQDPFVKGTVMTGTIYLPVVAGVQWEYAIQPQGLGFMGGYHGDEMVQEVGWYYDGVPVTVTGLTTSNIVCNKFEMTQKTFLYSSADHTTKLGEMFVRHIFTSDGMMEVKWELHWSESTTIEYAYGGMLPAVRQDIYTAKCRFMDSPTVYDISTTTFAVNPYKDTYGIELMNAHSNRLYMSVEMMDLSFFNSYSKCPGRGLWVTNDANYNKVYPSRVYGSTEDVTNATVWKCDVMYRTFMPS